MLVKGEGAPQNDLDSCREHLQVGCPIMISIFVRTLASWVSYYDLHSYRGYLLLGSPIMISILVETFAYWVELFKLGKAFDMISCIKMVVPY